MITAKEYLQQIRKLDMIITNKIAEKEQWSAMAMSVTASFSGGERVQASGSQQKMENAIVRYVDLEKEIDRRIDDLVDTKVKVIQTIERLPAIEYDILHKVYIQYKELYEVAEDYNKTYSWATTVHGRALKDLQDILNSEGQGNG